MEFCGISITVRKKRDPAILDREELFLQLQIEEINDWDKFCYPVSKSISSLNKRPYSSIQLKLEYYDKTMILSYYDKTHIQNKYLNE